MKNITRARLINDMTSLGLEIDEPYYQDSNLLIPCRWNQYKWMIAHFVNNNGYMQIVCWSFADHNLQPDSRYYGWNATPAGTAFIKLQEYAQTFIR